MLSNNLASLVRSDIARINEYGFEGSHVYYTKILSQHFEAT